VDGEQRVLSADSHVVEPWFLWRDRVRGYDDRVPRLVREDGADRLVCEDVKMAPIGFSAGVFRSNSEVRREGTWDDDVPASAYDPDVRIAELDADGIAGEVLFPTFGLTFYGIDDLEFKWALFRAYNDWLAEFCASHPDRYKGIAMIAHEDVDLAVAELERAAKLGLSGVMVPTLVGDFAPYHDRVYDPLWHASVHHDLPVHVHSATSRDKAKSYDVSKGRDPLKSIMKGELMARVFLELTFAGTFDRHPNLVFVSAENEAGWMPHVLERADFEWHRYRNIPRAGYDTPCEQPPTTYWGPNIKATFMRDHAAVRLHDMCGPGALMFQTDFPHSNATYPHSRKLLDEHFTNIDPHTKHQIAYQTAADLYHF
jgi:predicted TIM-barrel fold metal-dependent hydrolase